MIEKTLALSAAHLPSEKPDFKSVRVAEHEYGYIVFIADIEELALHVPQWLRPIYIEAINHECSTINFDRDLSEDNRFATYEW